MSKIDSWPKHAQRRVDEIIVEACSESVDPRNTLLTDTTRIAIMNITSELREHFSMEDSNEIIGEIYSRILNTFKSH